MLESESVANFQDSTSSTLMLEYLYHFGLRARRHVESEEARALISLSQTQLTWFVLLCFQL